MTHADLETLAAFHAHLRTHGSLTGAVCQSLDLTGETDTLLAYAVRDAAFLGCRFEPGVPYRLADAGALVFPTLNHVPYNPYQGHLYTPEQLLGAYQPGAAASYADTLDGRVYQHFLQTGGPHPGSLLEALARSLHDHAMTDGRDELIDGRKVVAIMGGHSLGRDTPTYAAAARIARALTEQGYLLASGGGPGAMEATHVGAYFAGRPDAHLQDALALLAQAPSYKDTGPWLDTAFAVKEKYPLAADAPASLGIPTWHYGHEPPNAFATHIAKYFANSIREDGLLAIATYGIVFMPGSAGTIQEIFQDAAQNHYESFGYASPMVFFDTEYWTQTKPVYPVLKGLAQGYTYDQWLTITDAVDEAVAQIVAFEPPG